MKTNPFLRNILVFTGSALLAVSSASAQATLFWDATPDTPDGISQGGAGTWDTTAANWDDGTIYSAWNNGNADTAVFDGTAGAINLGADVTVGGLTFSTGGYSIAQGVGPYGITFGAPGNINVSTGSATLTAAIGGSNKITKTGGGELILNAANTFSGGIDIATGRIRIFNSANESTMLGASSNTLTFTGNAELYNADGEATLPQNVTINSGVNGTMRGAFGERIIVNGIVDGSGTLSIQGDSAGFDVELRNTANAFTGAIFMRTTDQGILGVRSLADSSNTISLQSNGNNGSKFEFMSGATAPLVFNNRQFVLHTNGNSGTTLDRQAAVLNNAATANTFTINTDLAITGTGNKNFILGGSNSGNNAFNGDIVDAIGTSKLTLYKRDGGKWILGGQNTYEGNTIVDAGTLELADNASMRFVIGEDLVNNKILGDASNANLNLSGDFIFDLSGASGMVGSSWNIVDVANLNETFGSTFQVFSTLGAFTEASNVWSIVENGITYEFSESTGILTAVIPEPSTALAGILLSLGLLRRQRSA